MGPRPIAQHSCVTTPQKFGRDIALGTALSPTSRAASATVTGKTGRVQKARSSTEVVRAKCFNISVYLRTL